jgi:hypothetical protein
MDYIEPEAEFAENAAVMEAKLALARDLLRKRVRQLTTVACRLQELIDGCGGVSVFNEEAFKHLDSRFAFPMLMAWMI